MALLVLCACESASSPREIFPDPAIVDADGDGAGAYRDCDDSDPTVSPYEAEILGDDADTNCDGDPDRSATSDFTAYEVSMRGIALASNDTAVYLLDQADDWYDEWVFEYQAVTMIGEIAPDLYPDFHYEGFTSEDVYAWPRPRWTARPDLHVDDEGVAWVGAWISRDDRTLEVLAQPFSADLPAGARQMSEDAAGFTDLALGDQGDGTLLAVGCDAAGGGLVAVHGTLGELAAGSEGVDHATVTRPADACAVAALPGGVLLSDPAEATLDLYAYTDDRGLQHVVTWTDRHVYDMDAFLVAGAAWVAYAEGSRGLSLDTPHGELFWEGADARMVSAAATREGDVVIGVLDADGVPWLVWDQGGRWASLEATFPRAEQVAVAFAPDGEVYVAVTSENTVSWARWRLAE